MQYHTLTAPIIPPLTFQSLEGHHLTREAALARLNELLATAGKRHRARLPRGYAIRPAINQVNSDPQEWITALHAMSYRTRTTPDADPSTYHRRRLETDEWPVNPIAGHARAVWWIAHVPTILPSIQYPGAAVPAISFVYLAPAPTTPQDSQRAALVTRGEWLARVAAIAATRIDAIDLRDPQPPIMDIGGRPLQWQTWEDAMDFEPFMHTATPHLKKLPAGTRTLCTYLPHTDPPPPLSAAWVPPLAPVGDAHFEPRGAYLKQLKKDKSNGRGKSPAVIEEWEEEFAARRFEPRDEIIQEGVFLFTDPASPVATEIITRRLIAPQEVMQPLPEADPCAHVPVTSNGFPPDRFFIEHFKRKRHTPQDAPAPAPTPEDLNAEIDAL